MTIVHGPFLRPMTVHAGWPFVYEFGPRVGMQLFVHAENIRQAAQECHVPFRHIAFLNFVRRWTANEFNAWSNQRPARRFWTETVEVSL